MPGGYDKPELLGGNGWSTMKQDRNQIDADVDGDRAVSITNLPRYLPHAAQLPVDPGDIVRIILGCLAELDWRYKAT